MNIGQLSKASGVHAKAIRYYESIGLLRQAPRSGGNYRVYHPEDVQVLRFIKRSRALGFSLQEIETLLGLWRDRSRTHTEVMALARKHILDLEQRVSDLQTIAGTLQQLMQTNPDGEWPHYPIVEPDPPGT